MTLHIQLTLSLAILAGLCGCTRPRIETKELASVASPNGELQAKIAIEGKDTAFGLQFVYVIPTGQEVRLNSPDTAGMIAAVVHDCRAGNLEVQWFSDDRLEVSFKQERPSWINFVPLVQGVKIVLRNRAEEGQL